MNCNRWLVRIPKGEKSICINLTNMGNKLFLLILLNARLQEIWTYRAKTILFSGNKWQCRKFQWWSTSSWRFAIWDYLRADRHSLVLSHQPALDPIRPRATMRALSATGARAFGRKAVAPAPYTTGARASSVKATYKMLLYIFPINPLQMVSNRCKRGLTKRCWTWTSQMLNGGLNFWGWKPWTLVSVDLQSGLTWLNSGL